MASKTTMAATFLVIGLLVGFGGAYVAASSQVSSLRRSLAAANESDMTLHSEVRNGTSGLALQPRAGQMFHSGWVFISPIGSGDYAVYLHAEGLEASSAGSYIVEGVVRNATTQVVPVSGNATASEFEADPSGTGGYWTTLMENPTTGLEAIDLVYLPGMEMTHAVLVASVQLG